VLKLGYYPGRGEGPSEGPANDLEESREGADGRLASVQLDGELKDLRDKLTRDPVERIPQLIPLLTDEPVT